MPRYITLAQYKSRFDVGMAAAFAPLSDLALANIISMAESDIDDFMEFDPLVGGFEPHTCWYQHRWDERTLKTPSPNGVTPVRVVDRYRIQVSNLSTTGAGFFASINPADCVINVFEQYVEIVPLQAVTYSLSPVILQLGLRPPIVQMDTELGFYLPALGDTLYDSGDQTTYYALRGFWAQTYVMALSAQPAALPPVPPVVYVNGVLQASNTYTINYAEGSVKFNAAQSGHPVVTADYTYQIPDRVRDSAIIQTTYLLGQIQLNKMGMQGVEQVRSGFQQIKRHMGADMKGELDSSLHADAAAKLLGYKPVAVA
jgi:hypothetical protein